MLQIVFKICITLVVYSAYVNCQNVANVDWMFETVYSDDAIPVKQSLITLPIEIKSALDEYASGNYRRSIEIIEKYRALNLPDGKLDFVAFVLAESYRQLNLKELSRQQYQFVIENFPESEKVAPCYYRLVEFAGDEQNLELADSIMVLFQTRFMHHSLFSSVLYLNGKIYYKDNRFGEAIQLLSQIPKTSSRFHQAQFLSALCNIQMQEYDKALIMLDNVRRLSNNPLLVTEAGIVIGDIYYSRKNINSALQYYRSVPKDTPRYQYAQVKTARAEFELGNLSSATALAQDFLKNNKASEYFFEMASILEQVYTKLGKEQNAAKVSSIIHRQIIDARLAFEIFEEIDLITDIQRGWQLLEYTAIREQDKQLLSEVREKMSKIKTLENRYRNLLNVTGNSNEKEVKRVPHLAERRYLNLLKNQMTSLNDSSSSIRMKLESFANSLKKSTLDTLLKTKVDSLSNALEELRFQKGVVEREHELVILECLGGEIGERADEEMQVKFIDWAFIKYIERKTDLVELNKELSAKKKGSKLVNSDSVLESVKSGDALSDINKLEKQIKDDRKRIRDHISTMLEVYPKNRYNAQILLRLAELYFDDAGDDFQEELLKYEAKMAGVDKDTSNMVFPEYKLSKVIEIYDEVIKKYPKEDVVDDAYFYKALAFQKTANEDSANLVLLELIDNYPESEFFVEANMSVGRYFFEHPKTNNGQGYKLAEEAYRKVLFYRDHPQFVQALYHLGWCYYMQDLFEEAIAVFKYLVEEVDLDFDPNKTDDQQVINPLMRGEAVDYIAISFDEEGKIEDAIRFLELIGNPDYAAMVLQRIGELREEDLDADAAIKVYQRSLKEYPSSISAPDVLVNLIKLYETKLLKDSAMIAREHFFNTYGRGGVWQKELISKDSLVIARVDSMAISIGLYVADVNYRVAESTKKSEDYKLAVGSYQRLVEKYPAHPKAAEARWNLAVILDTKVNEKPRAFNEYLIFSRLGDIDSLRREQSAQNAIAIAQSLLPPDSLTQDGTIDFAANKLIESVENYTELFPDGKSFTKVLFTKAAVLFNRKLYEKAIEVYIQISQREKQTAEYYEAILLIGKSNFGLEKWTNAVISFETVWKESPVSTLKEESFKLLLQSEFLNAKALLTKGDFENAAVAFRNIDDKYPGSEYSDIVLFNAAEALEKKELWIRANDQYLELVRRYPASKLAVDALFNAAGNFEKTDRFAKAAEAYEQIVTNYSKSDKCKDALFNLGFCYEKIGKLDKMAETNERYGILYPGEKDVELLLMRSGNYYFKAGMYDRAMSVFKNFVIRFPSSSRTIECMFMMARCYQGLGDKQNAYIGFTQTEQQNQRLSKDGLNANLFFASEAAYYSAELKRETFSEIKLNVPQAQLQKVLKAKSELLNEAAKSYQRVIQYQSERMFEAAYRVGQLYEEIAVAYKEQERAKLDPIKAEVLEKDILTLSSQLLQQSFIPYRKAIDLAQGFDSLGNEQLLWLEKSRTSLLKNFLDAGGALYGAVAAMYDAPVPKEIRDKPLHFYQYQKQLHETLDPLKSNVRDYYLDIVKKLDTLKITGSLSDSCRSEYAKINYQIPSSYDLLSQQILKNNKSLPTNLTDREREDLVFQLEDIVFELQDKSIFGYEDALEKIKQNRLESSIWYHKTIEALARISPEKYGKQYYKNITVVSEPQWLVRSDSVENWVSSNIPQSGWSLAILANANKTTVSGKPQFIWGDPEKRQQFFWKHLFVNGEPLNSTISIATAGKYRLFVNGTLVLSDTVGTRDLSIVDSATGITSILRGGDNILAIDVTASDSTEPAMSALFTVMIDTTKHFESNVSIPVGSKIKVSKSIVSSETFNKEGATAKDPQLLAQPKAETESVSSAIKNSADLQKVMNGYRDKARNLAMEIRKERLEIQKIRLEKDDFQERINQINNEIDALTQQRTKK